MGETGCIKMDVCLDSSPRDTVLVTFTVTTRVYCIWYRVGLQIINNFQELESDIVNDLGGHFRDVALALLQTPQDFMADNIHKTLKVLSGPLCAMIG
jgi:hypothetical protein